MNKFPFSQKRVACLDVHSPLYIVAKNDLYGGGDLESLYALVDKAAEAGFSILQFNPIHDTVNASPYLSVSSFSYNPAFLSLKLLASKYSFHLAEHPQLKLNKNKLALTSYRSLYNYKLKVLEALYNKEKGWESVNLEDFDREVLAYAVFKTLKRKFKERWVNWPVLYKKADLEKILARHPELHRQVKFYLFIQGIMKGQWQDLASYADKKNVLFIFDKPIYPIHDSADVWANQKLFYLNPDGTLQYESGCNNPRDPFGPQRWGHAVYKFQEKSKDVTNYFIKSISFLAETAKIIRLDHTLALIWKYYIIDPKTKRGIHLPALRGKLFLPLMKAFPNTYFIAEDVGYINKREVDDRLARFSIPGFRCPQWVHIPKYSQINQYPQRCVAMTANHDLKSLPAWWHSLSKRKKEIIYSQIPSNYKEKEASVEEVIRLVFSSPAALASITLRDIVNDQRKYNTPGKKNNFNWKLRSPLALEEIDFSPIAQIIRETGRS